jgi:hypothetical protein
MQVFQTLRSAFDSPCSHSFYDVQLRELSALQTHYGSVQLRSTFPRTSRRIGKPPSKRNREGSSPSWCTRRVRLLARSEPSQGSGARSILARGAASLPAAPAALLRTRLRWFDSIQRHHALAKGFWRRRSERCTTRFDSARGRRQTLFWDRLTVGRELLELAIVVRLHGPELLRPVSSLGERRSYKAHQVGSIPSRGTANHCTATWVRGRA